MSAETRGPWRWSAVNKRDKLIATLAAAAFVVYALSSHGKPKATPLKPYAITAPALYAGYKRNEVAEQMRIGKRPVLVAGVIRSIDQGSGGVPYLKLGEGNGGISYARMTLLRAEKLKAARLRRGEVVTVLCLHMKFSLGDALGSLCIIATVQP